MTIYGPDISSYQAGLDLSRLTAAAFVIAKTTEGTYYTDGDYQRWRRQAAAIGRPFVWYHFLSGEDATAQAKHTLANVGDTSLPGMLDAEPAGGFSPTLAQMIAYVDAAHGAGLNLRLIYLPRWYWQQIGSPDLTALRDRGVSLVSSAYPGGSGSPAAIYPGDEAVGWQGYGGMVPLLYQFTNQASDGGQLLDYNAVRGSVDQLVAFLHTSVPAPAPPLIAPADPEDDMPVFATGEIKPGADVTTIICPPPANSGAVGWGPVWFSLASDWGDAHVRVAIYTHPSGWKVIDDLVIPAAGDRVIPFGGPLPTGVQKISLMRKANPDVPLAWLIEAAHR